MGLLLPCAWCDTCDGRRCLANQFYIQIDLYELDTHFLYKQTYARSAGTLTTVVVIALRQRDTLGECSKQVFAGPSKLELAE